MEPSTDPRPGRPALTLLLASALASAACSGGGSKPPPGPCDSSDVCTSPPAATCVAGSTTLLRTFPSTGTCTDSGGGASCAYAPTDVDCAASGMVCEAGGCVLPDPPGPCDVPADGAGFLLYVDDRDGDYDVRAVRVDGTCDQPFAGTAGDDFFPAWSSAAGRVAWSAAGVGALVTRQLGSAGGDVQLDTGTALAGAPALSPDGATIAFERLESGGTPDVYLVPFAGGAPTRLVGTPAVEATPVYAPDGQSVYVVSTASGAYEVWRYPLAGGPGAQVTSGSSIRGRPAVSPDGRSLAFAFDDAAGGPGIRVADLQSGFPPTTRELPGRGLSEPAFDSTGSLLAVRSFRDTSMGDVVLLDAATGAVVRKLTTGTSRTGMPAFPR